MNKVSLNLEVHQLNLLVLSKLCFYKNIHLLLFLFSLVLYDIFKFDRYDNDNTPVFIQIVNLNDNNKI